ncbi:hypothetical protein GGR57DRAFT_459378 [Xylariaceae sp. FL1272]|nr:hypothetical protein GGR57DRAFT_459378 [Xylariaceae sp. FL1272]
MKLHSFLLPTLATVAAADAAPQHAEAYIITQSTSSSSASASNRPSIPDSLAEAILLQRLSTRDRPSALGPLPDDLDAEDAISYISQFGVPSKPLFQESLSGEPRQLVIAFSGIKSPHYKQLTAAIPSVPVAFTAPGLNSVRAKQTTKCQFAQSIDPQETECWSGNTQYLHYDVSKNSRVINDLTTNLATLESLAQAGEMETTILLLDPSSPLRKRQQQEKVMSESATDAEAAHPTFVESTHDTTPIYSGLKKGKNTPIPACFKNKDECMNATGNCSGHGWCTDKWYESENSCFSCSCKMTFDENEDGGRVAVHRWGGQVCQKRDVSTPFWLFAGVTITLALTIAFAIGLLFSVGEEKLPGVIGAGVSRSK